MGQRKTFSPSASVVVMMPHGIAHHTQTQGTPTMEQAIGPNMDPPMTNVAIFKRRFEESYWTYANQHGITVERITWSDSGEDQPGLWLHVDALTDDVVSVSDARPIPSVIIQSGTREEEGRLLVLKSIEWLEAQGAGHPSWHAVSKTASAKKKVAAVLPA